MALKTGVGSGNKIETFVVSSTGLTGASLFVFDKNTGESIIGHPSKGTVEINADIVIDNQAYNTYLQTALTDVEVVKNDIKYTNSTKDTLISGLDDSYKQTIIKYAASVDSLIKVVCGRAVIAGDTGNFTETPDGAVTGTVQFQIVNGLQITITSDKFDATKVSGAADVVIPTASHGTIFYLSAV